MKISFYIRKLSLFSNKYIEEILIPLTLGRQSGSIMCRRINRLLAGRLDNDVAILVHDKDRKVIAWSLTYDLDWNKETKVMLFVQKKYRGKGIGRKLINKTFKYLKSRGHEEVYVAPWNKTSTKFYSKIKRGYWNKAKSDSSFTKKVIL